MGKGLLKEMSVINQRTIFYVTFFSLTRRYIRLGSSDDVVQFSVFAQYIDKTADQSQLMARKLNNPSRQSKGFLHSRHETCS